MKEPSTKAALKMRVHRAKKLAGLNESEEKKLRKKENQKRKGRWHRAREK